MTNQKLLEIVSEIKKNKEPHKITPRNLLSALGCERRTSNNVWYVNEFLRENQLEVTPDFTDVWIDNEIDLKHKAIATSKTKCDPVKKISVLEAANRKPLMINNDAPLVEAITYMLRYNYSQMPVTTGPKNVIGYISWETIGSRFSTGMPSGEDLVKDYIKKDVSIIAIDTPLLKAIKKIYNHDFVVVTDASKNICGLVTTADISSEFLSITEPFLLMEQIENRIRQILGGKLLLEHIQEMCKDQDRCVQFIDDLTFGEYIKILEKPDHWNKLGLSIDKTIFVKELDAVRKIRNGIMHFEPNGLSDEELKSLRTMAEFLENIS
jgi:predicted transcriptional regulator